MNSKPRTLRSAMFLSALMLCAGLAVPWFCSSRYRVLVCKTLYQTQRKSIQDWSLRQLIDEVQTKSLPDSERANALTVLFYYHTENKLQASSLDDLLIELIDDLNPEVTGMALEELIKQGGDIDYDHLGVFGFKDQAKLRLTRLAQDPESQFGGEAYVAMTSIQEKSGLSFTMDEPHSDRLVEAEDLAKQNVFTTLDQKGKCPPVVAVYEVPKFDPIENSNSQQVFSFENHELYFESFEPGLARHNAAPNRSLTALVRPLTELLIDNPIYVNYRGINDVLLTKYRDHLGNFEDTRIHIKIIEYGADRSLPANQSLIGNFLARNEDDLWNAPSVIEAMSKSRRQQLFRYLSNLRQRNITQDTLLELFQYRQLLDSNDAAKIAIEVKSGLNRATPLSEFFSSFSIERMPQSVHEQLVDDAITAMRTNKINAEAGLQLATILHRPLNSVRLFNLCGSYPLVNSLSAGHNGDKAWPGYASQWLKYDREARINRIIATAIESGMDIAGLMDAEFSSRRLSTQQIMEIQGAHVISIRLRRKISQMIALALLRVAKQASETPEFSARDFEWFNYYDAKSLVRAFRAIEPAALKPIAKLLVAEAGRFKLSCLADWNTAAAWVKSSIQKNRQAFWDPDSVQYSYTLTLAETLPADKFTDYLNLIRSEPQICISISSLNGSDTSKQIALKVAREANDQFKERRISEIVFAAIAIDIGQSTDYFKANETPNKQDLKALELYYRQNPTTNKNFDRREHILVEHFPDDNFVQYHHAAGQLNDASYVPQTTKYATFQLDLLTQLFLQHPRAAQLYVKELRSKSSANEVIGVLHVLRHIPFASQEAINPLCALLKNYHTKDQLAIYNELLLTLIEIDRKGKATIPALSKIILDPERTYIYRAMALCSLRRYYELNNIESVLTDLQAKLQGDLRTLAARSLERVRELRSESVLPYLSEYAQSQ